VAEGIDGIAAGIEKGSIEILLTGLLFLRSAMVVDGKKDGFLFPTRPTDIIGGFAAVASDFQAWPLFDRIQCGFIQPPPFVRSQEALDGFAKGQIFDHGAEFPFQKVTVGA
jgi:hypothetical protein